MILSGAWKDSRACLWSPCSIQGQVKGSRGGKGVGFTIDDNIAWGENTGRI